MPAGPEPVDRTRQCRAECSAVHRAPPSPARCRGPPRVPRRAAATARQGRAGGRGDRRLQRRGLGPRHDRLQRVGRRRHRHRASRCRQPITASRAAGADRRMRLGGAGRLDDSGGSHGARPGPRPPSRRSGPGAPGSVSASRRARSASAALRRSPADRGGAQRGDIQPEQQDGDDRAPVGDGAGDGAEHRRRVNPPSATSTSRRRRAASSAAGVRPGPVGRKDAGPGPEPRPRPPSRPGCSAAAGPRTGRGPRTTPACEHAKGCGVPVGRPGTRRARPGGGSTAGAGGQPTARRSPRRRRSWAAWEATVGACVRRITHRQRCVARSASDTRVTNVNAQRRGPPWPFATSPTARQGRPRP